jgi:hypothetical protein
MKRVLARLAVALSTIAATWVLFAGIALPAQAYSWSSTVYLKGSAGCSNVGGIQEVVARGALDGRTFESRWSTNGNSYAPLKFTNVRAGRVPSGGGWAWVQVTCSMGGVRQGWVEMYRPPSGDTIIKNF